MSNDHTPSIGLTYWLLVLAIGAAGNMLADTGLRLFGQTLPAQSLLLLLLAGLGALVFELERHDRRATTRWYWLALAISQTAATVLSDLAVVSASVPRFVLCIALAGAMVATFLIGRTSARLMISNHMLSRQTDVRPMATGPHWVALVAAGMLATAAGDLLTFDLAGTLATTAGALIAGLALIEIVRRYTAVNRLLTYWSTLCLVRTGGTVAADLLFGG